MKVPLRWLYEYVGKKLAPADLIERLTLAGLEVASVRVIGEEVPEGVRVKDEDRGPVWPKDKVIVAKIMSVNAIPDADKLKHVTIQLSNREPFMQLVTGAPNVKVGDQGQWVIVLKEGAEFFDHHAKGGKVMKVLKAGKVRGIDSPGMVASAYELGITDDQEGGIILLDERAPTEDDRRGLESGRPAVELLGDIVLELDVLPNMARCLSMIGVAREVAALTGQQLRLPPAPPERQTEPVANQVKVAIEDPALSARYLAMLVKNVKVGPTPGWMARRLLYAGITPRNENVVDITNYVMLEWGQPLHAFDFDVLRKRAGDQPPTITVRRARAGETLVTLDKVDHKLTTDMLVIADAVGPIALAGVMGGEETKVTEKTTSVLLESANFDFLNIRRTMRELQISSDAGYRFSRGIHPELVRKAAERAADLMQKYANGRVCAGVVEAYPRPLPPQHVILEMDEVRQVLGMSVSEKEVLHVLGALEFAVEENGPGSFQVTTPPHRLDIQAGSADLIEELARVHGYDKMPATMLADALPEQHGDRRLTLEEHVRDLLAGAGLQEVITYSLTMPEREAPLGEAGEYVRLKNPVSAERVVMRRTLLAGVLEVAAGNLRNTTDVRLFEVGPVYLPKAGEKLPDEPLRLALVLTGRRQPEFWAEAGSPPPALDFFDLKGVVETLAAELHLPNLSYRRASAPYLHPGRSAELLVNGQPVGSFGQLHPRVAIAYSHADKLFKQLLERSLFVAEVDLEALLAAAPERYPYRPVSPFEHALRDIAVVVPEDVTGEQVVSEITAAGGALLRHVRLFDVYHGPNIPAGTKSLAFALTYQSDERTLTDKEITEAHRKIEAQLRQAFKAQIRGEETR